MAETNLNIKEGLRPWEQAGLKFLLINRPVRELAKSAPRQTERDEHDPPEQTSLWPEPWASLFKAVRRPARTVWTYMELGLDLSGSPDPARRETLLKLTSALAWPKGSIAYWPLAVPKDGNLAPDKTLFLKGAMAIRARLIVCFGRKAAEIIEVSESSFPKILVLPELPELNADQKNFEQALTMLRQALP